MQPPDARVLIVEDNITYREDLRKFLARKRRKWALAEARDESTGLKLLRQRLAAGEPIDVVITDLVMGKKPNVTAGLHLIKGAVAQDPLLQVILYSRNPQELDRFGAFGVGAFDVINIIQHGEKSAYEEILVKADAALRFRQISRQNGILRRYFSQKLLDAIEKNPKLLEPRQQTATICFWDIRRFSRFCENLKTHPEVIAGFLKEYCDAAARIIFERDGMLDKYIGDGVMALFGVLHDVKGDNEVRAAAVNAVRAAIDLRREFNAMLKRWKDRIERSAANKVDIGIGCGIHTDTAFVGNVGTVYRDQFTALGPAVNIASRFQAESEAGQIIVSQSTMRWVQSAFRCRQLRIINDIKNITGDFPVFEVTGRRTPSV